MKTLERRLRCRSGVFIVNCEHISHFVLIVDFEQANVCWVHIEKHFIRKNRVYPITKMGLTFKMTCCIFAFLQILLTETLIRFYLDVDTIAFMLL